MSNKHRKAVVVTGASSGIGRACALELDKTGYRVTQAFLPLIPQAQGRIINIGSVVGKTTMPFYGALCASKYAVEAIDDALYSIVSQHMRGVDP